MLEKQIELLNADCLEALKLMPDNCIDAIVTDPPYGLAFMGKKWDYDVPSEAVWVECLRVLKPGGHLLAFAGTRTQHRMAVRIEDAGFEIRDMIAWVYGSGFPKSLNVAKVADKYMRTGNASWNATGDSSNGALGYSKLQKNQGYRPNDYSHAHQNKSEITEDAAKQWQGWGTALKPSLEPITLARKPLIGTVVENVLTHGTGGINIDGCRVETSDNLNGGAYAKSGTERDDGWGMQRAEAGEYVQPTGRWPANLIHDGSDEVTKLAGDAARFFYCAKASKKDRGDGNDHPTVKPTDLMRYLCRLVTPPNGVVLDPFMGSGSTGKAAVLEGFKFIGIEREAAYFEIAKARINNAIPIPEWLK